jgi:hypothetical protein
MIGIFLFSFLGLGGFIFDISIPPRSHHWWVPNKKGSGGRKRKRKRKKIANLKAAH